MFNFDNVFWGDDDGFCKGDEDDGCGDDDDNGDVDGACTSRTEGGGVETSFSKNSEIEYRSCEILFSNYQRLYFDLNVSE